jgi:solute carrier family 13 (sodium-dependent dicarboxylate transporter), member 2/3/5
MDLNPLLLMLPATFACSFAFMLPVATPPNAIVASYNRFRIAVMLRTGFVLNLTGVVLITVWVMFMGRMFFGAELTRLPDWAQG